MYNDVFTIILVNDITYGILYFTNIFLKTFTTSLLVPSMMGTYTKKKKVFIIPYYLRIFIV